MRKNPYLVAVVISMLFYIISVIILIIMVKLMAVYQWGDIFSLGQLVVDFCLVPIAIIGFVVTITELRKTQQRAALDIFWMTSGDELSKSYTFEYPKTANFITYPIVLINKGNSPSIHYQINLECSLSYGRPKMRSADWKHARHQIHKFIFRSEMQYISFPEDKVELGEMEFSEANQLPEKIELCYRIFSDNGEYKSGRLQIEFQKVD
jgi:hypothetical protein